MEAAIQRLQDSNASPKGKRTIEASLRAAANPNGEKIDVIIAALPEARREQVEAAARKLNKQGKQVTKRGKQALQDMSDAEWDALINGE